MRLDELRDVFQEQLQDAYSVEQQLTQALPKLMQAATAPDLRQALQNHLLETEQHMEQVRMLLSRAGVNAGGKKCKGIAGIIEESSEMLREGGDSETRDAGLIAAAQKAEHYEIATYGTLESWARMIGETEAARVLKSILEQEYAADKKLTQIAESHINRQAM
jgi:ferritin-like metal-binding protein YciE